MTDPPVHPRQADRSVADITLPTDALDGRANDLPFSRMRSRSSAERQVERHRQPRNNHQSPGVTRSRHPPHRLISPHRSRRTIPLQIREFVRKLNRFFWGNLDLALKIAYNQVITPNFVCPVTQTIFQPYELVPIIIPSSFI